MWALGKGRAAVFADCFLPGSLVRTSNGYLPIEAFHEGMNIETLHGSAKVSRFIKKSYNGETVRIKTSSAFFPIEVTSSHKFYVLRRSRCIFPSRNNTHCSSLCGKKCSITPYLHYKVEIVKAAELTIDDCFLYRQPQELFNTFVAKEEYLRFAGYWLAEGWISRVNGKSYGIHLGFNLREKDTIAIDALECLRALGIKGRIERNKEHSNVTLVCASNHTFAEKLIRDFGEHVDGKKLPNWFYQLKKCDQKVLLTALFNGDAYINIKPASQSYSNGKLSESIRFVTVSYKLAFGVRDALLGMGIRCSGMHEQERIDVNGVKHKPCYRLLIPRRFMKDFNYIINVKRRDLRQVEHFEKGQTYTVIPIRSITYDKFLGTVYNLTSSGHDSYLTDAGMSKNCGLGKTFCQLEWSRIISQKTGGDILIVAPLSVSLQTRREATKIDIDANVCRNQPDVKSGINITNYEMLDNFDASRFVGVVVDESSILKSYTGVIKNKIISMFKNTRFKLACTATPSPNDHMEILNHCDFLGVMKSYQALAIWFINDTMHMGQYRLKKHAIKDFWKWVSSWACSLSKPSDYGYKDDGFILPPLNINEEIVSVDITKDSNGLLFRIPELSATSYHKEKRISASDRAIRCKKLVDKIDGQVMIWCDTNYEADDLKKTLPGAVEVRGSDNIDRKENITMDFVDGRIKTLISKPSIFGFGLNFQNCHSIIYCGLSFSFESYYQSIRRFWRFGQKYPVDIYIVISETEKQILNIIKMKEEKFLEMKNNMNSLINEFQDVSREVKYKMECEIKEEIGENYRLILGDSIEEIKKIEKESIGLIIFSPPFSNLYIYSDSFRDMGNNKNDDDFFKHFSFMLKDLLRVTMSGRLCCIHCKDLVNYKNRDGASGLRDFPGRIIIAMEKAGWQYHSRVTIWKDPVIEMQRTKSHGLLYKQLRKDSSYSRQGLPDYILTFRKWTDEGDISPVNWKTKENFPLERWQRWASPVWDDIRQTNVLNIQLAREGNDEKHIAPLQLDVVERCVELWSNPGDTIFSPFMGIGSEGYKALELGRKFVGIELKESYYNIAKKNLEYITVHSKKQLKMFGD